MRIMLIGAYERLGGAGWRYVGDDEVDVPDDVLRAAHTRAEEEDSDEDIYIGQDDGGAWTWRSNPADVASLRNKLPIAELPFPGTEPDEHWQAFIGSGLWGEGATEEEARENAVWEYERGIGYGDWPRIVDEGALRAQLSVGCVTPRGYAVCD